MDELVLVIPLRKDWSDAQRAAALAARRAARQPLTVPTTSTAPGQAEEARASQPTPVVPTVDPLQAQRARARLNRKSASAARHHQTLLTHGTDAFRSVTGREPNNEERAALESAATTIASHRRLNQGDRDNIARRARLLGRDANTAARETANVPGGARRPPSATSSPVLVVPTSETQRQQTAYGDYGISAGNRETFKRVMERKGTSLTPKEMIAGLTGGLQPQPQDKFRVFAKHVVWNSQSLKDANGKEIVRDLERSFRIAPGDQLEVHHDIFRLANSDTAQGWGKKILRSQVDLYKKLGVDFVSTYANIDVGKYAWARYGFLPSKLTWDHLREDYREILTDHPRFTSRLSETEKADAVKILQDPDPRALWNFARLKTPFKDKNYKPSTLGKEVMLAGKGWDGTLNLHNQEQMKVFDEYVKQTKKTKV